MKDFESLTVISVEHYCKLNPVWSKGLRMINSWTFKAIKKLSNVISYITLIK